jgi:hypothetical protein
MVATHYTRRFVLYERLLYEREVRSLFHFDGVIITREDEVIVGAFSPRVLLARTREQRKENQQGNER